MVPDNAQAYKVSCGSSLPMRVETILEQMWVDEETGEVDWREVEVLTARKAGYLDDTTSSNIARCSTAIKKRKRAGV